MLHDPSRHVKLGFWGFKGHLTYTWTNAIRPYLKSLDLLACPSNPYSHSIPGRPNDDTLTPGKNAAGWELEPEQRRAWLPGARAARPGRRGVSPGEMQGALAARSGAS